MALVALCQAPAAAVGLTRQLFSEELQAFGRQEGGRSLLEMDDAAKAAKPKAPTGQAACDVHYGNLFPGKTTVDKG